ncbi:MAG: DUF4062 domain-containing protein [Acidobacteriota bacterium]
MAQQLRVMISSTVRDLPEHRKEVMDACLRQGMFPIMMEHLPASDDEAVPASLKMVDEADIYLLILAHRYGYVPAANNPEHISVTEHEYNRAGERKLPILSFAMHKDHPLKAEDVEKGEGAIKLEAFRNRVLVKGANFFTSPAGLRADVINSLSHHRKSDLTAFHFVSDIPKTPDEFVAHPYILLQTHTLIGRQWELKLLTDWITGKDLELDGYKAPADSVRIMSVVAMGGMGKSALTWKWFKEVAPEEMKPLAGRMWWSFYESDATFENFISRALAYVSRRRLDEVKQIPTPERESELLSALDHEPFLLVLDGLERILIAYARIDASRVDDSEVGKDKRLRKTVDPKAGSFLKKLLGVKHSRILLSSRLYPAELERFGGDPSPGAFTLRIEGLTDEDAVDLWRAFDASGSRDKLLAVFKSFSKHPLLIQVLAGEVKSYRKAPGDFDAWRKANPQFDPSRFSKIRDAMGHVLEFALRGLKWELRRTLQVIAAFRMPTTYDTLTSILVGKGKTRYELKTGKLLTEEGKLFSHEKDLDGALSELEDRGLLGWDKRANRYDLHPIVRSVAWQGLRRDTRYDIYTILRSHFEALPRIADKDIRSVEDLTSSIELYSTLIGLEKYPDAAIVFANRLKPLQGFLGLSADKNVVELLEAIPPPGWSKIQNENPAGAAITLVVLGVSYRYVGLISRAVALGLHQARFFEAMNDEPGLAVAATFLSQALCLSGALYDCELWALRALTPARKEGVESFALFCLALGQSVRNVPQVASVLERSRRLTVAHDLKARRLINVTISQYFLRLGNVASALSFAERAIQIGTGPGGEHDLVAAYRLAAEAKLGLGELREAEEQLHSVLAKARELSLVEEELPAVCALADLRLRARDLKAARVFLDDVWEMADRGPYPIFQADAFNILAQVEAGEGNTSGGIEAATRAYRLAWCDGPPFAYHWGLENAKKHLRELGAPEPEMPPFDESKFEPLPEVEIDPEDEFHVGNSSEADLLK